ncbi:hypothetical protein [Sporosarcina psychrophila]|uniref:hypothetical protein n=1 Tax=Sporosarcina psychrophila TaxID=1476 RepID=UPI00078B5776|nr:hypothetical protein [Sporosarcina psychrophila]AMQ06769.1 hypothetical protein AZE41_12955 [Sporosarcina psychrophila]
MGVFIKDFRSELKSDIWMMPPLYHRVWQYLKYKVNHSPNKIPMEDGNFFSINPGQHLTSVRSIAQGVGYYEGLVWKEPNPKTVSTILAWLEKQQMIEIDRGRGNRQYTLVTVSNWDLYQVENGGGNSKETASGEAREQPADIKKNDKEGLKNDKELKDIKNSPKQVYDKDSPPFILADFFYKEILKNDPKRKEPNLQTWSDDIRKMIELDKRDKKEIGELMRWVQQDEFERANVLSPSKLRTRYTSLLLKMKKPSFPSNVHQFEPSKVKKEQEHEYDYGF